MREMCLSCLLFKKLPQPQIAVTNECVLIPARPSAHCCRHYFRRRASLAVHHTFVCHEYITYSVCQNIPKSKEKRRKVLKRTGWLKGWVELPHFIFMLLVQVHPSKSRISVKWGLGSPGLDLSRAGDTSRDLLWLMALSRYVCWGSGYTWPYWPPGHKRTAQTFLIPPGARGRPTSTGCDLHALYEWASSYPKAGRMLPVSQGQIHAKTKQKFKKWEKVEE